MDLKRIVLLVVLVGAAIGGVVLLRDRPPSKQVLHVFTWSNYFPDNLLQDFTQKTGIEVSLTYFSSNEELLAKLKAGASGFDIIQPSDYMVRQMHKLDLLDSLEHGRLPNLKHLDPYYTALSYDVGNKFSVPFTWGTTGIAINTAKFKPPLEGISWTLLTQPEDPKHTSLLDDMREVFGAFLLANGFLLNDNRLEILKGLKPQILETKSRILMFSSEPKVLLERGEIYVAHIFSCDAIQAKIANPDIEYFIPREGATIWTDNFSIPKSAKNKVGAHIFIDYFLDPENAFKIVSQNHLATPNRSAKSRLPASVSENPHLYPSQDTLKKLSFLEDLEGGLGDWNRLWTEIKL